MVMGQHCAFCLGNELPEILDFGNVALAGGFLAKDELDKEVKYPLRLLYCETCFALQVSDHINPSTLFGNYFYSSSNIATLKKHFGHYAAEIATRFLSPDRRVILEIGCNDGVMLSQLAEYKNLVLIGVDPAKNIVESIKDERLFIINDYFTERVSALIVERYGGVDVVVANNVYAHISDINSSTKAIVNVLGSEGVFVFENHYLPSMLNGLQYDMIYHEHLYYYSIVGVERHLNRHGLVLFDAEPIDTHGGSMRFYACKKDSVRSDSITSRLGKLRKHEVDMKITSTETFRNFAERVSCSRKDLLATLDNIKRAGGRIAGYGASGRSSTIIQYCGLGHQHLDFVIDDNPLKWGFYTPGAHFKIVSRDVLTGVGRPDYILLFAWAFLDEIKAKCSDYIASGGKFITPLPNVKVF